MNIPYVFRKCTKCGEILPATTKYFYKDKRGKYGLRGDCKKCSAERGKKYRETHKEAIAKQKNEYMRRYYQENKEDIKEYQRQYYQENKEDINERNRQYYEANKEANKERCKHWREVNKEYRAGYQRQYYQDNKEAIVERVKQYYETNKETIAEYKRQWREQNKEAIAEYHKVYNKKYYEANKETFAEYGRQYRQSPQGQVVLFNRDSRRRAKEQAQGNGITKEQWLECMSFFNFRCAYSGEYIGGDGKGTRTIDHIVPLNKGGANEIWNVIPAYKNYNSSKQDKDLLEWYTEQPYFSQDRLDKIYEWQEYAFNKWGNINTEAQ